MKKGPNPHSTKCLKAGRRDSFHCRLFCTHILLFQKCHEERTSSPRLRIQRGEPFNLSACEDAAKKKKKRKEGNGKERMTYEFDGFKIVTCEEVDQRNGRVFTSYTLELNWE